MFITVVIDCVFLSKGKPLGNLTPDTTAFFCCDMQERFRPAIKYFEDILSVGQRLVGSSSGESQILTHLAFMGLGNIINIINVMY